MGSIGVLDPNAKSMKSRLSTLIYYNGHRTPLDLEVSHCDDGANHGKPRHEQDIRPILCNENSRMAQDPPRQNKVLHTFCNQNGTKTPRDVYVVRDSPSVNFVCWSQ